MSIPSSRVLIVGCGFPQLGLIRFCRGEGLEVVGLDLNPEAVGVPSCQRFVRASTADPDAIARAVRSEAVDGLTTAGSDLAVLPTALAAEATGRPFYMASDLLAGCVHKHDMRARFAHGGAPSPAFAAVRSLGEAETFAHTHGLPVVLKPARGWGQRGVRVVMRPEELAPAVEDALTAARSAMPDPCSVIEQFVEGREFSVDAYTYRNETRVLAITERIITGYPDPPGITYAEAFPSGLDAAGERAAGAAAIQGLRALGFTRGPCYTQLRVGPRGAFILETALRLGGGLDPEVTFLASGESLYRKIVGVALGRDDWERTGPEAPAHGGAVGRFIIGQPGRVVAIRGLDEARRAPGIVGAEIYVKPGGTVYPLTDGSKRAGHVLATGSDRDQAEANARRAMDALNLETEPA